MAAVLLKRVLSIVLTSCVHAVGGVCVGVGVYLQAWLELVLRRRRSVMAFIVDRRVQRPRRRMLLAWRRTAVAMRHHRVTAQRVWFRRWVGITVWQAYVTVCACAMKLVSVVLVLTPQHYHRVHTGACDPRSSGTSLSSAARCGSGVTGSRRRWRGVLRTGCVVDT